MKKLNNRKQALLILIFSVFFICYLNDNVLAQEGIKIENGIFKIQKIEKIKNGYVIDVSNEQKTKWYTIVSLKKRIKGYPKIKVGEVYKLNLKPYFKETFIPNHALTFSIDLEGKNLLAKSRSWTGNVYTTNDLCGLQYLRKK